MSPFRPRNLFPLPLKRLSPNERGFASGSVWLFYVFQKDFFLKKRAVSTDYSRQLLNFHESFPIISRWTDERGKAENHLRRIPAFRIRNSWQIGAPFSCAKGKERQRSGRVNPKIRHATVSQSKSVNRASRPIFDVETFEKNSNSIQNSDKNSPHNHW